MIAMRIMTPTDKKRSRLNGVDAVDYVADCLFGTGAFAGDESIGKAQENDIPVRVKTEFADSLLRFLLSQVPQTILWIRLASRMRARAVADDDDPRGPSFRASLRDQSSAGEALIVRMGGNDDQTALPKTLIQRRIGGDMSRLQYLADVQRRFHKSEADASASSTQAAALVRARSGPGCRR